ncbi:MAG: proton-conducting transporter membrane subunit [Acidimicrobiales bacterium]
MLFGLIALHAAAGLVVLVGARRLGRWGFVVGGTAPLAAALVALASAGAVLDGRSTTQRAGWVPQLGLTLDLRLDALRAPDGGAGVGDRHARVRLRLALLRRVGARGRAAGLLTLFAGSMLGVVLADNLLVLYGFWELTSITSYLLIGLHDDDRDARDGALRALLVTGLGGLAMLGGFVLLGHAAGTLQLSALLADPPSGGVVPVALVLVLLGAFTKSAQYPFHSWLPGRWWRRRRSAPTCTRPPW